MTCEDLRDSYELYVFGTLEDPEREQISIHLKRGCPVCTPGVEKARMLATHLAMTAPSTEPPATLSAHVMRSVVQAAPHSRSFWESSLWRMAFPVAAIAALALLLVDFGMIREIGAMNGELHTLQKSTEDQRKHERDQMAYVNAYRAALALMTAKGSREVRFGPRQPEGRLFLNPKGLVMIAADLPQPPPGRTYELWILRKKTPAPEAAGVFDPDARGGAIHMVSRDIAMDDVKAIALSDEPPGGGAAPTGKIFLIVPTR